MGSIPAISTTLNVETKIDYVFGLRKISVSKSFIYTELLSVQFGIIWLKIIYYFFYYNILILKSFIVVFVFVKDLIIKIINYLYCDENSLRHRTYIRHEEPLHHEQTMLKMRLIRTLISMVEVITMTEWRSSL